MLTVLIYLYFMVQAATIIRVLLRPNREPASRLAWIVVIFMVPMVGILAYALLGETNIGHRRVARLQEILADFPDIGSIARSQNARLASPETTRREKSLFRVGKSISGFDAVDGNSADLLADSNAVIDRMVADIESATRHVHLLFYIWMPDNNGKKIAAALQNAAARGVICRVLVDDLGSKLLIRSPLWAQMKSAGIKLGRALKIGNPILRALSGRVDLRNHRKILVIDNLITYCGSQNCADPEFLTKAKYAPWVDAMMRFTGPVAMQNQSVFVTDWMMAVREDIRHILLEPIDYPDDGFIAQVIVTGPTVRNSAASELFESLIYSAAQELIITTPYYAPKESVQGALCAAANRGVETTIIFPARNDDFAVGATCRSYYAALLAAGVKIFEYRPGLLHTKSMTIDGEVTLIGSTNMDRRSFELNFENNILLHDRDLTQKMRQRQNSYLADSHRITAEAVDQWSWRVRLWNNTLAIVSPIL